MFKILQTMENLVTLRLPIMSPVIFHYLQRKDSRQAIHINLQSVHSLSGTTSSSSPKSDSFWVLGQLVGYMNRWVVRQAVKMEQSGL
jgi:hypothetical protein